LITKLSVLFARTRKIWAGLVTSLIIFVLNKNGVKLPTEFVGPAVNAVIVSAIVYMVPNAQQILDEPQVAE
jgi:hypothetical protein